jgi:redox-sensitive bicupin YhaK (pirin superfamily)
MGSCNSSPEITYQVKDNCPARMFRRVPNDRLFVSEPNPEMFGNPKNPREGTEERARWADDGKPVSNWLRSRFHFSFAEYRSGSNNNFSHLRVMNDDLVQGARGFGTHPHSNTEICTFVVDGELTHQDSMGTAETLTRGAVQFMSAGRGVRHSEHNLNAAKSLRFIQMWINTRERNTDPKYGSHSSSREDRSNKLLHLVGDQRTGDGCVQINQDANIFVTELDEGESVAFMIGAGRCAYALSIEARGFLRLQSSASVVELERHDAAEIIGPVDLVLENGPGLFLMVEMPTPLDGVLPGRTDL